MTEPRDPHIAVNFGQAQLGDVAMRDVASHDIVTQHYYGSTPAPAQPAFQVPYPPNPLFRGRDAELAELMRVLLGDNAGTAAVLPAISGTGGIGKTQMASEFAHAHRDAFPGGVFWIGMEQPEQVAGQVAACAGPGGLELQGWAEMGQADRVAAVKAAWRAPVRRLIVFDNLEEPKLLQAWRPTGGGARVLVTTRRGVWAAHSGVEAVSLHTLARSESLRLLLAPRHGDQIEATLADPTTMHEADAICEQVGDLPLALALAGAYLEQTPTLPLASYRTKLAEALIAHPSLEADLDEALPTQHRTSIAATIALSYERLDPMQPGDALALMLLQRMAQLAPVPVPRRLLVCLVGRDPDDAGQSAEVDTPLHRLAALGLIDLLPDGASLHRLMAAFVRDHDDNATASTARAADGLITEVSLINKAGYPLRGQPYLVHLTAATSQEDGLEPRQCAILLTGLGNLLKAQGDLNGARRYLKRALAINEQVLGPIHPDTASSLGALGWLIKDQNDLIAARPLFERALAINEQVLGMSHPATASSLVALGELLKAQNDLAGARPLLEQALAIREQSLGLTHSDTASSLVTLGWLLKDQNDLTGARPLQERALAIREQVLGSTHPDTASSLIALGELLKAQGDLTGARLLFEGALAIHEQILGLSHPSTASSLITLGWLLKDQGDLTGARILFERALAIREKAFGPTHPDTVSSLITLGWLLKDQNDLAGARPLFERVLALNEQALGPDHLDTRAVRANLADLARAESDAAP